ncbi:hypothetical protein [Serratia proteamaculans]|uniref:hypothetical protein n=1 Tax=Serratia proteamaculans TaxID=28151 RepID=UPI003D06CE0F
MQAKQPVQGERIELRDMGTTPVQVPHRAADGTVSMINAERREWQMDALDQDGPATHAQYVRSETAGPPQSISPECAAKEDRKASDMTQISVVDIEESHEREID